MESDYSEPYRVLSIDGGGILGYYEACVLHEIAKLGNKHFEDGNVPDIGASFNMICGTSTGSILAVGLAKGVSITEMIRLYKDNAKDIFPFPMPSNKFKLLIWTLRNMFSPSSNQKALIRVLGNTLGETTFSEIWKSRKIGICIPAVNAKTNNPTVFKTPHHKEFNQDNNLKLSEACLASSAVPVYFPIARIADPMNTSSHPNITPYVDGGIWANNPVLIGLSEALKMAKPGQEIEIYSIGAPKLTEVSDHYIDNPNLGLFGWNGGGDIVKMALFAQSSGSNYTANLIATSLRESGREVNIYRLPEATVSSKQLENLDLDRNDDKAFNTMLTLAENVTAELKLQVNQGQTLERKYLDLFSKMSNLEMIEDQR